MVRSIQRGAATIFAFSIAVTSGASAETWIPLQFRQAMPIAYLVDVDGLRSDGSRRSIPGKWILSPDAYQLGSWQFDCRSRAWKSGGSFTIVKSGTAPRSSSQAEAWRSLKPGSPHDQLATLLCQAPLSNAHDWLAQQLPNTRL